MSEDPTVKYLELHLGSTFPEEASNRSLLNVDWFQDKNEIRAAIYMTKIKGEESSQDIIKHNDGEGITDLVLLCPPMSIDDF